MTNYSSRQLKHITPPAPSCVEFLFYFDFKSTYKILATLWLIQCFLYGNELTVQFTSMRSVSFIYLCFHTPKTSPLS